MRTIIVAAVLAIAGCGGAEIGEECDTSGSSDECVDGAICTNEEGDTNRCRRICDTDEDCREGEGCNGISGSSTKRCQPDTTM